jgi:hypothetical protein
MPKPLPLSLFIGWQWQKNCHAYTVFSIKQYVVLRFGHFCPNFLLPKCIDFSIYFAKFRRHRSGANPTVFMVQIQLCYGANPTVCLIALCCFLL